jgi:hypothetical protein
LLLGLDVAGDMVGGPRAALAHRLWLAGGAVLGGLMLDLAVQLGADHEHIGRQVHPRQQRDHRAQ